MSSEPVAGGTLVDGERAEQGLHEASPVPESQTVDTLWRAQDTTPTAIESALRSMLAEAHANNASYTPARVLNLVCIVDKEYAGEIANRLRKLGRFHASRTVVCSISARQTKLDAVATIAAPSASKGAPTSGRETVVLEMGPRHLKHLDAIVDPLVLSDLPTAVWSPHGHPEAVAQLLQLSQIALIDSVDAADPAEGAEQALELMEQVYVVDLAWLRSTPWRERIAAAFDPQAIRPDLNGISRVSIRHHPDSGMAAALLVGWLASRLGWRTEPLALDAEGALRGKASCGDRPIELLLDPEPSQQVRGLASVELTAASGRFLSFDRGPGGLTARRRMPDGSERTWTIMGASRGESGILGEGLRQALLRDHTYKPALVAAQGLLGPHGDG